MKRHNIFGFQQVLLLFLFGFWAQAPNQLAANGGAQDGQSSPSADVIHFIKVDIPVFALTHVRVIDGTGAPALNDQTIVVDRGRIVSIGSSAQAQLPHGATELDYHGHTVLPGLVGMHDHLFYTASLNRDDQGQTPPPGYIVNEIPFSAPRLYLAAGVTTIRTTGSVDPYSDLGVKLLIDTNQMPGPNIHATGPYLDGPGPLLQSHVLTGPDDVKRMVAFWADNGFTSWKAYMFITRDELRMAIDEAHKRGMKVSAHLCSVTWREAIALGIDDLEHGPVYTDTSFVANKAPDSCPSGGGTQSWTNLDVQGAQVQGLIKELVAHRVAVTSTLPVFEASLTDRPPSPRVLEAMSPESRSSFLGARAQVTPERHSRSAAMLKKEMEFEHAFSKAGGLLLAGPDPTGNGGVLPGFGDWRELELLVEAGFTPLEAIQIATLNGAEYLGVADKIGAIAVGKQADLVVIKGDPSTHIEDIRKIVVVFKDGVGYDSEKLFASVKGQVGIR